MTPILAGSILDPLYSAFGTVLAAYFSVVKSYGVAIALLTLTVRVVLIPLTAKQVRSQQAMTKLQPEMKRIQAKYKNDRQKLNEEMMALYKEHGANPLSGCLPLILQMPLFIVLYRLIHDLSTTVKVKGVLTGAPKHLPHDSVMYKSLVESVGKMPSWGMDLAQKAGSVSGGLGKALPYYILVALVVATGFYQQRQMSARTPKDSVNPQMQMVMKIFPAMFGLISLQVPAGVVVYFIVSNLWQIGQQAVTFRTNPPAHLAAGAKDTGSDSDVGGGDDGKDGSAGKTGGKQKAIPAKASPTKASPTKSGNAKGVNAKGGNAMGSSAKGSSAKGSSARPARGLSRRAEKARLARGEPAKSPRPVSGRAQPKKVKPSAGNGRPAPSARPKGLPSRFRGSSNGQAQGDPKRQRPELPGRDS